MAWFGKNKKQKIEQDFEKSADWSADLKRTNSLSKSVEQQDFIFSKNVDTPIKNEVSCTKLGLSRNVAEISSDQIQILKKCKLESSAEELMNILKRTHKTRFKNDILNPLLRCNFFERTIPEKPKSPKQKYRLTNKFVRATSI